jgi:hypothetical protein
MVGRIRRLIVSLQHELPVFEILKKKKRRKKEATNPTPKTRCDALAQPDEQPC